MSKVRSMPHKKRPITKTTLPHPDSLTRMRAYQLACEVTDTSWDDAEILRKHPLTAEIATQLYTGAVSIAVNLGEGYSRSSGRDRARIFEYALGSVRECIDWYAAAAKVLNPEVVQVRQAKLVEIRRILLKVIPLERNRNIRPSSD